MNVKGFVFLTEEAEIQKRFNEARWKAFRTDISYQCAFLNQPVFPTSQIPLTEFIALQRGIESSFFDNDITQCRKMDAD